jgi:hypothetical protein
LAMAETEKEARAAFSATGCLSADKSDLTPHPAASAAGSFGGRCDRWRTSMAVLVAAAFGLAIAWQFGEG